MHYRSKKSGQQRGRGHRIVTPNKLDLTFLVPDHCVKFDENRIFLNCGRRGGIISWIRRPCVSVCLRMCAAVSQGLDGDRRDVSRSEKKAQV